MSELWHFTCAHQQKKIGRYGLVIPRNQLALGVCLAWFTNDRTLSAEALGLTSHTLPCDRMEFSYRVLDTECCEPFLLWARRTGNPFVGRLIDDLKRPEHWYVSNVAVRVTQDREWRKERHA